MTAIAKWEHLKPRRHLKHQLLVAADLETLTSAVLLRLALAVAQPKARAELVKKKPSLADAGEKLMKRRLPGRSLART